MVKTLLIIGNYTLGILLGLGCGLCLGYFWAKATKYWINKSRRRV